MGFDCFAGPSKGRTEVERWNPRFKDSLISFIWYSITCKH